MKLPSLASLLFCASLVQTITSFYMSPSIGVHHQSRYKTELSSWPRRDVLGGFLLGGAVFGGAPKGARATSKTEPPVADLPMIRLKLPQAGLGREYVAIKLKIDGKGPFDFMVDSGLTTELITPHLQQSLGIAAGNEKLAGLAAGGGTVANSLIDLDSASLCCGKIQGGEEFKLPKLHAVITDFPQEHIDPAHNVEGMLGMELLSLFDVDFDFKNNRLRFWKPGTADTTGLVEIPAVVINESGLIGIRLSVPGAKQPILAFLDCGSTFSCMNWKAAAQLGLPPKTDPSYSNGLAVSAVGIDGRLLELPIIKQELTFTGDIEKDSSGQPIGFYPPPKGWKNWDPVNLAIGDLPAFRSVLGDGVIPYEGPAALVGLDILGQRRVIFEAGRDKTRRRRIFMAPK